MQHPCVGVAVHPCLPLVSSQYWTSRRSSGITRKVLWEGLHSQQVATQGHGAVTSLPAASLT